MLFDVPAVRSETCACAITQALRAQDPTAAVDVKLDDRRVRVEGQLSAQQALAAIHAADPLDAVLITGDMTDAGRSAEWAEFLDAMQRHPALAARSLILPGNHDVNIVDRANPARLELPGSPGRRLRQP